MDFEKGNIVSVLDRTALVKDGAQGVVQKINTGLKKDKVSVLFDEDLILGFTSSRAERILYFKPEDLRKDEDWSLERKATRLFGRDMFHSLFALKAPFDTKKKCLIKGCRRNVFKTALINYVGNVQELHVCKKHYKKYNGLRTESFPEIKETKSEKGTP